MQSRELSGRRFTTTAINIIEQIEPRSADRSMDEFTQQTVTMLVLWSILRWERKVGLVALERVGVKTELLARAVDRLLNETCAEICNQLGGFGLAAGSHRTSLEPLLKAAEDEAILLGHDWVGTEHLLLAAIRSADKPLRNVLKRHRALYESVRQAVIEVLRR